MGAASGVYKQVSCKKEVTFGVKPAASAAQSMRRESIDLNLKKDSYGSNEIRQDLQKSDFRHGVRRISGKASADLSPQTWADFFGSFCKRVFTAGPTASGLSLTIAGSGPYTITRSAGSWLSDNIKIGQVGRLTSGGFNAANLNKNLFVTAVTATVLTVITLNASALVAEGPIATSTFVVPGKQTWIPTTGHIEESYTIEQFYPEVPAGEVFTGCKITGFNVELPPTGISKIGFDIVGKDMEPTTALYFTSPTAPTTTTSLAAVNGVLRAGGQVVAVLTGLSITGTANYTGDPVVGSNAIPQFFPGPVEVSGQATAYFDSVALRDSFVNETEIDIIGVYTSDNSAGADFMSFIMPRVKINDFAKSDGAGAVVATIPFQALLNGAGGAGVATEKTTLMLQDSAA